MNAAEAHEEIRRLMAYIGELQLYIRRLKEQLREAMKNDQRGLLP